MGWCGLAIVAALAAAPAWFLGMTRASGVLFVAACVATRAARRHRRLQQTLRVVAATLFFSYAQVTFMLAFPPVYRLVFFGVIIGAAVALYESAVQN